MARRKTTRYEVNLLRLVPERLVDHELGEDGMVTILAPRFRNRIMKRLLESRMRNRFVKIRLDEIGSAVWLLCDGGSDVGGVADTMSRRFGERIEPCHDRLAMFFTQLEASDFIRYSNLEEIRKADSR